MHPESKWYGMLKSHWEKAIIVALFVMILAAEYLCSGACGYVLDKIVDFVTRTGFQTFFLISGLIGWCSLKARCFPRIQSGYRRDFVLSSVVVFGLVIVSVVSFRRDHFGLDITNDNAAFITAILVGEFGEFFIRFRKKSPTETRKMLLLLWLIALAFASICHPRFGLDYPYHDHIRWKGLWENPNGYGLIMGSGLILAFSFLISTSLVEQKIGWKALFYFGCCNLFFWGLGKSYCRGAWVGCVLAGCYLVTVFLKLLKRRPSAQMKIESGWNPWINFLSGFRPNFSIIVLAMSALVICYWASVNSKNPTLRRFASIGNLNDFSWKNRLYTVDGALLMIAERPLAGWGWSPPEKNYNAFYKPQELIDGGAIDNNNYLVLALVAGMPALLLFLVYIFLSFQFGNGLCNGIESLEPQKWEDQWITCACLAASMVLLVGFLFDRGIFRIALTAPLCFLIKMATVRQDNSHPAILKRRLTDTSPLESKLAT